MLTVNKAQQLVLQAASRLPPIHITLGRTPGFVLSEDVRSDLDMPPYDKSLVDGFAVMSSDLVEGRATLQVVAEVIAGQTPPFGLDPGSAMEIMT